MDHFQEKEVIQAILIADNNVDNFRPLSDNISTALLPLVNVPLLDYALESLNHSGIEEVFVFSSFFLNDVREHIKKGISSCSSWSVNMTVQVIGGESCRSFGDAMRDLDAKGLIRGNFVIMGADTVTNANLRPIFNQHKKTLKYDKGAAATVIFKEASSSCRTGNEIMIAMDEQNSRLHYHQRIRMNSKESHFEIPLDIFLTNSQVTLHHNLIDPQIAIGSPTMLSLFSDNFDFETRDDFIKGILINEELLDCRIYVSMLPNEQYARKVNNWLVYQIVSNDVINRWAYPLVPDMGVCCLWQNYIFLKNNIYKSPTASLAKVVLRENVVVQGGTVIGAGSVLQSSVVGSNCRIGKDCRLTHAFVMDGAVIEDGCTLSFCVVGPGAKIGANSSITLGAVVGDGCIISKESIVEKDLVQKSPPADGKTEKIGEKAYIINDIEECYSSDSETEFFQERPKLEIPKMKTLPIINDESDYNSVTSDEDGESRQGSPIPDDANIFLSEVLDSLARGIEVKSNPDFLILEINSSRYAYNMSLKEVNFNVVKAVFSLEPIKEAATNQVLSVIDQIFNRLGSVIANYIKTDDSMMDCLKAIEECCEEQPALRAKVAQIIHYLYDKEIVSEEAIRLWHKELDDDESTWLKAPLAKLIDWLDQSSEGSSDEEDDD
ncbi:translation initiation factor eIF-2B subunit epsilon [Eupeodes corollae]|uniref:translation initiation factor eIF-2B subunit epsilon n=1 Tax=Eupeodes corollae TaxID=290404 RepID=UPI002492E402|nr:translation initiation factor eIF-2B subunit epsilon [Eupeodes corollae]